MLCCCFLVSCLVLVFFPGAFPVQAGAWGQQEGKFFLSMQAYFYSTDKYYDHEGNRHGRGGTFNKFEINPYMEYGITDRDTLVANLFLDVLTDDASGSERTTWGPADMELGLQHKFYQGRHGVMGIQALLIVPTGYDIDDDPRLGYGRFGGEVSLLYGKSFSFMERWGFVDLHLGIRDYFGYPSTQLRPALVAGYDVTQRWQVLAWMEMHYGLDNGTEKPVGPNILIQPNYRLLKLSLGARYRINTCLSVVAAGYQHAWGEDTGCGGGAYASLWYSY